MWQDMNINSPIQEGTYWLDNGIIKAFKKETGELCYLYKYIVNDDLSIVIKQHKDYKKHSNGVFETWEETVKRHDIHLNKLESQSISLLQKYGLNTDRIVIDTSSTGKDSEVKTYLAKKAGLTFKTYFNVTTLDVGECTKLAKQKKYNFIYPDKKYKGFYQYIKHQNIIPSRLNRFCCTYFKEEPTIFSFDAKDKLLFLFGMRNSESSTRSKYEDIWINQKWGKNRDWIGILPVREWTDLDIWLYIFRESISINPKYKMGYPRVGCAIACPNYSKTTWVLDKYWYPKMYNRWQNILRKDFITNNKWLIMNCTINEYCSKGWNGGVFREEATEEVIKEYAKFNNLEFEIAKKYFNRYCSNGCLNNKKSPLKIKDKSVLGMNMKLFGRNTEKFMCKKCLMKQYQWTQADYDNMIEAFKLQGCSLF